MVQWRTNVLVSRRSRLGKVSHAFRDTVRPLIYIHQHHIYRLVGHQNPEHPWCYSNGEWKNNSGIVLDYLDEMNALDLNSRTSIDRHDCVHMDVNKDGTPDIVCVVGADKSKGKGFNELYLTSPIDGSITKVLQHGLQKYTSLSTRKVAKLKHEATGRTLLFVTTNGRVRLDGKPNQNQMFITTPNGTWPYFHEFYGKSNVPWRRHFKSTCLQVVDVNNVSRKWGRGDK